MALEKINESFLSSKVDSKLAGGKPDNIANMAATYALYTEVKGAVENVVGSTLESNDELLDILSKYANNPDKIPTLNYAVKMRDLKAAEVLIAKGMDVNKWSLLGMPLQIAIGQNNLEMAKLLIRNGSTLDSGTILRAVDTKSIEALELLQNSFKSQFLGYAAQVLPTAIYNNNESAVAFFVQHGYQLNEMPNGGEVLFQALKNSKVSASLIHFLINNGMSINYSQKTQKSPSHQSDSITIENIECPIITAAIERGDVSIITSLLIREASCNIPFSPTISFTTSRQQNYGSIDIKIFNGKLEYIPLYKAVQLNRTDIVDLLLKHGAKLIFTTQRRFRHISPNIIVEKSDLNSWNNLFFFGNDNGQKPFDKGLNDLTDKIDTLAKNKKIIEVTVNGDLLMMAIERQNPQMVKLLLEAGHPVNFYGNNGKMPIKFAVETGNREIISLLLNHGAEWDGV